MMKDKLDSYGFIGRDFSGGCSSEVLGVFQMVECRGSNFYGSSPFDTLDSFAVHELSSSGFGGAAC